MIHACGSHALGAGRDDGVINGGAPIFLGVVLSERPCVKMCVCVCVCVCVCASACLPACRICLCWCVSVYVLCRAFSLLSAAGCIRVVLSRGVGEELGIRAGS
jgi:hypothetical protein